MQNSCLLLCDEIHWQHFYSNINNQHFCLNFLLFQHVKSSSNEFRFDSWIKKNCIFFFRLGYKFKDRKLINSIQNYDIMVWLMRLFKSDDKKVLLHYILGNAWFFVSFDYRFLLISIKHTHIYYLHRIWPAVLRQATYGTIKFGTYYTLKKVVTEKGWLIDRHGDERVWCNVLCAVVGTPLNTLSKMQYQYIKIIYKMQSVFNSLLYFFVGCFDWVL